MSGNPGGTASSFQSWWPVNLSTSLEQALLCGSPEAAAAPPGYWEQCRRSSAAPYCSGWTQYSFTYNAAHAPRGHFPQAETPVELRATAGLRLMDPQSAADAILHAVKQLLADSGLSVLPGGVDSHVDIMDGRTGLAADLLHVRSHARPVRVLCARDLIQSRDDGMRGEQVPRERFPDSSTSRAGEGRVADAHAGLQPTEKMVQTYARWLTRYPI